MMKSRWGGGGIAGKGRLEKAGGRRNTGCEFSVKLVMNVVVVIGVGREDVFLSGFPFHSHDLCRKTAKRLVHCSVDKKPTIHRVVECVEWPFDATLLTKSPCL